MMALILQEFGPWIAAGAAALVALIVAWMKGRSSARLRDMERRVKGAKKAEEIEDEVEALPADALRDRARRWVR